ncbi:hypothetical protein [uncultured Litoreibacter sp.]|uniref:hypothetical protein n=1 Tax=uncultured Litoreibacter sp. TaxID=1392394 RepID=UPI0026234914|nr:hypothetical protein [uncultured Litoreibacter sp.]
MNIASNVSVAEYSIVGATDGSEKAGSIGQGSSIGSFCHIAQSVVLGEHVHVDNYVRVGAGSVVGDRTRLLFNATIDQRAKIGMDCIISGNIPNDVVIGDFVSYQGNVAHSHRNPEIPWDEYWEPSPIIHDQCVIGVDALLIGPVEIGPRSYIGAREVVRHNIPADSVFYKGEITPLKMWRGIIQVRTRERMAIV